MQSIINHVIMIYFPLQRSFSVRPSHSLCLNNKKFEFPQVLNQIPPIL
jgi:hypothetical protein